MSRDTCALMPTPFLVQRWVLQYHFAYCPSIQRRLQGGSRSYSPTVHLFRFFGGWGDAGLAAWET
jgi:hypothetical protein